jgi:CubicO group peptidase (beta-lactamase class C family)
MLDKGQLTLDDSVAQYIPTAPSEKRPLTVRQLFSFTSGFRSNLTTLVPCVEDVQSSITLAECVDNVLADPLVSDPGELLNYGSEGMHVAGRMAEIASGLSLPSGDCWDTLFTRNLADPLGWTRTSWDIKLLYNTNNPRIDGGVYSTADEYLRLTRMILDRGMYNGTRVISEAWIDSMLADQTRGARISYTPYLGMESLFPGIKNTRYGIGVWRERIDSTTDAALEVASQGKFGFSPWVDFQRGYCAVLAIKSNDVVSIYPTYMEIKRLIREALDAPTSVEPEDDTASWTVIGHYDLLGRELRADHSGAALRVETNGRERRARMIILQ